MHADTTLPAARPGLPQRRRLLLAAAAGLAWPAPAPAQDERIQAEVRRDGDRVIVDVTARVDAPLADAWATLTDYERMASFVANLNTSRVLRRDGERLEVAQSGATRVGLLSFSFTTVRAIELVPMREIRSRLISGDFTTFESVTRFSENGGGTVISYHGEFVPTAWLPPLIGPSVIRDETRKQYGQLLAEIVRRRGPVMKPMPARGAPP